MAEATTATVPESTAPAKTVGNAVLLRDRYFIDSGAPLPELDSPSAKAFHAEDRREPGRRLFALICTPGLPPRTGAMALLKGTNIRGVLPLVEYDTVDWPPLGQRCMAVIYDRPLGGRVIDAIASGHARITEYDLRSKVIEPLIAGLNSLSGMGVAHREIRPSNLFYMDTECQDLVFGDCVTTPPGFDQPIAWEPVERGLASAGGRGTGDVRDDLYALGVTLVFLMLGQNPVGKLSEDDMFAAKMEHGTYATLCGGARIPLSLLEPLRGILTDDAEDRWGLEQMSLWLDGRQLTPIQRRPVAKADNPFMFGGRNHVTPRTIARAFTQNVTEANKIIRDESLETWLRRNLSDADKADRVRSIVDQAKVSPTSPQANDDYVVTRVAMVLDPRGPVRYRGFAFMPEGFGAALAIEFLRRGDAQVPAEALQRDLPSLWLSIPDNVRPESVPLGKLFTQMRTFLQINDPGYGIERCLYELNPSLPCQSPLIIHDYVVKIEELLPALDRAVNRVDTKNRPMDRHIAAFIAARFNQDIDPHLRALAAPKVETSLIGMLSLLAYLQWKLRPGSLFGLSSWLGGLLGPAINTYHSRTTRREIEREIPRLVRQGSLPELFDLIDNAEKRKKDNEGYTAARAEYAAAESEVRGIESKSPERLAAAERKAQQTAATVSLVASMFVIMMTFLVSAL
jgi:serine/threonine protein kinase